MQKGIAMFDCSPLRGFYVEVRLRKTKLIQKTRPTVRRASSILARLPVLMNVLLITACAVGPDYIKPPAPEPKAWIEKENPKIKSEPADFSQWWTVFNDPVLNTLIEKAYQQNLDLRAAGIRILEARARLGIATGSLYPQVQQGRGALHYLDLSKNQGNTLPSQDFDYSEANLGFDVGWELDFWGKFRRAVESGMGNLDAFIANYDDILVTLTAEVARTYVLIRTLEGRLQIAHENVRIQERSLQIAQIRFKGGEVTELDAAQAKSLLRDTQALIPRLEISLRQAKNALSVLLGQLPSELNEILGRPKPIPAVPAEVAVGVPAELLRRRPDIRAAERLVAAQSGLIGVTKADLYPAFSLFGQIGFRASDSFRTAVDPAGSSLSNLFDSDSVEFMGGPAFTWNLFNYGRIKNQVRVQDARFQQLVVNYQNTVLRAAQEVEDAMVAFLRKQQEVLFLSDSVEAAKRSVEISMIQYREGLVDYQRVLDTQRFQAQEQDLLTSTTGDVALNLVGMYKALGGGWQIREGKDFVPEEIKAEMVKRTDWGGLLSPEKFATPPDEERLKWQAPDL
jgi:NodT family efflux transporter outer membrane factor (OMF) lipoprotein